jgi:hypothetical protein
MNLVNPYRFAAAATPTFVAVSAVANDANVAVPSGTANSDLMVAFITNTNPGLLSTPSGWTRIGSVYTWTTLGYGTAAYYRVASSEPANYSFGSGTRVGYMVSYRNASVIDANGSYEQKSGTSMAFTGITSSSGSLLLSLINDRDSTVTLTQPSGMTLRLDSSGTFWRCGLAELLSANNSTRTWTASGNIFDAVGILVAIK